MYNLSHFKAHDPQEVLAFMEAHPFALLCGAFSNGQPVATQIPVLVEQRGEDIFILGHFMRKQDHHLAFVENKNALVVFTGAHSYISASLYPDPRVASTWNYKAVHASGEMAFMDDDSLWKMLDRLTEFFEGNPHSPALVKHMDETYMRKMMGAIIGFEIKVEKLDHVFKLSQTKDEQTRNKIISALEASDNPDEKTTAEDMKQYFSRG